MKKTKKTFENIDHLDFVKKCAIYPNYTAHWDEKTRVGTLIILK